jgi:hypothetical protein
MPRAAAGIVSLRVRKINRSHLDFADEVFALLPSE